MWGYSLALRLLSSLVAWLVAYCSAWNHSCWSPSAGPTLTRILPGTMSSPQFHWYIYGLRLEMKVLYYYAQYWGPDSCSIYIAHLSLLHLQVCFGLHSSEFNFSVKVCWWGEGTNQLLNVSFFKYFVRLVDTASWDSYFFLVPFLHKMFVWLFVLMVVMFQNVINMIPSSKYSR